MNKRLSFDQIVQTTGDLPTMPHIATLVMQKVADPNTTSKDLHETISKDQALAARILKIANSPFYGCARHINRLTDAIMVMGFNAIRSLVTASALNDLLKSYGLIEKLLWEHSTGCAALSKKIAKAVRYSKTEEAFLAGLLHDVGKIVINLKMPDKMREIVQEVYNNPGTTFAEVELDTLGFTHAQVGQLVARKWMFAEEMEEAIGCHHEPERAKVLPALSYVVNLANGFCHKLEIGPTKNPDLDIAGLSSARALKLDSDAVNELFTAMSEELSSNQDFFSL
jgi:putative nucleotidyltransferase with HDIG domain